MAGIQGNIIVSTTEANVTVSEDTTAITITQDTTNVTLVAGDVFFPYDAVVQSLIPQSNGVISLGNTTRYWKDLYVENITASNTVTIGGNTTIGGIATIGGNTTIGGDANITGSLTGPVSDAYGVQPTGTLRGFNYLDLIPSGGDVYHLGNTTNRWDEIFVREVRADFYEGRNLNPGSGDANNPSMANALVLNTNSLMHRGNAIYMDSDHGSQESDEKTVIGSGGAEGDIAGVVNGIMFDNAANSISIGDGIDLQNPENSSVSRGIFIDIQNSNVTMAGANNTILGTNAFAASFKAGSTVMDTAGFTGDGSKLQNITPGNINGLNTDDVTEAGQLYYTTARANTAITGYTGALTNVGVITGSGNITAFNKLISQNGGVQADSGTSTFADANVATRFNVGGNINMQSGQIDATGPLTAGAGTFNGNLTVNGNIDATGNINYQNVTDLYVTDQKITLNANATTDATVEIISNRPQSTHDAKIVWNEPSETWTFMNGDNVYQDMLTVSQTKGLLSTTTGSASGGGSLAYDNTSGVFTFAPADTQTDAEVRALLSTTTASASAGGSLAYDNSSGVFTFAPADLSAKIELTGLSVTTVTPSGDGALAYDNTSGVFTFTPASHPADAVTSVNGATGVVVLDTDNIDEGSANLYYTDARVQTKVANLTGDVTTTANVSGANVNTDHVISASGQPLQLKGQTNGIELDKTISSADTRIVDIDTTGYSLADATTPADFTVGDHTPTLLIKVSTTAGSNIATCGDIFSAGLAGLGKQVPALRGPTFSASVNGGSTGPILAPNFNVGANIANVEHAFTTAGDSLDFAPFAIDVEANGINNPGAGLYGTGKGWSVFNLATASGEDIFPIQAYTTGVSGGEITFSENAIATQANVTLLFNPGMVQTSSSNVALKYYAKNLISAGGNAEPTGIYGKLGTFDQPETLANVTFDALSYGNTSSVVMSTVNTKNMADIEGSAESVARFPRGLLIGPSTTPDPLSGRTGINDSSALGVILENDGETYTGNNAPAAKFLVNSYSGNLDDLTYYPNWGVQGATGNVTLDMPQLKAPQLQLKSFRGAKSTANAASYLLQTGDVVGKVVFSPGQTSGTGFQGADLFNPPSAITVDVGDANITTVANAYMHITTTPAPGTNLGYARNNANADAGANQQTNFTTKGGNVTIGAQVTGKVTLAPTPDYGDAANSTVWTRYPGSTHEYHTYLDAGFKDKSAKTGTLIEIQPKSGTTTGTGGLGYDSKGDSTLRLTTHEANSAIKKAWEITNEQASGNLIISDNTTGTPVNVVHFDGVRVQFDEVVKLQNLDTTAINALPSPEAGDTVYNTTLNQLCFYNGTAWQKITSATM